MNGFKVIVRYASDRAPMRESVCVCMRLYELLSIAHSQYMHTHTPEQEEC